MTQHTDIVVDQFTQQATPFAASTAMRDEEALKLLVEFSGAGADDTVLDVACGPGIVVADMVASDDSARANALNKMEKLRDPAHARTLPLAELRGRFTDVGLPV